MKVAPVPTILPAHEPVCQVHTAPAPRIPPVKLSVALAPKQIDDEDVFTCVGAVDEVLKTIEILTQEVVLQSPSALTK